MMPNGITRAQWDNILHAALISFLMENKDAQRHIDNAKAADELVMQGPCVTKYLWCINQNNILMFIIIAFD